MRTKLVVVDEYPFAAIIRDNTGLEVQFKSVEYFTRITGFTPDGNRINYEPDKGLYIVDGVDKQNEIPDSFHEELLSNIQNYLDRQADPLYGLTGEALLEAQNIEEEETAEQLFFTEITAPVEVTVVEGTFTFSGGAESASFINNAILLSDQLSESDTQLIDINSQVFTFGKQSAKNIAVAVGVAFRSSYSKLHAEKVRIKNK